jgi:hypothetical protein
VFINGRDQFSNKRDALNILTAKVNELLQSQTNADYAEIRKAQLADGGRSSKIRTYNFMEGRVVRVYDRLKADGNVCIRAIRLLYKNPLSLRVSQKVVTYRLSGLFPRGAQR